MRDLGRRHTLAIRFGSPPVSRQIGEFKATFHLQRRKRRVTGRWGLRLLSTLLDRERGWYPHCCPTGMTYLR